ncbi:hypothetical protein QJQ45_019946 [Haematococcus lacustris]|nr:hypothetical protein QJQ45_019946 [Haematococcus lacustris]
MLVVLGNGWRDGDSGHLGQLSYTCLICLHSTTSPSPIKWAISKERSDTAARCSECSTVHEQQQQQQQQQAVVYEHQCKDSSSSGWAAVAGCRCVAAAGCRCVAVQVAAGCRCASVHEQQQQQAGVHVLQCMSSSSSRM